MLNNLLPSALVNKSTCRIECSGPNSASVGTGFWFSFVNPENASESVPLLVTNKHVIDGGDTAFIRLNVRSQTNTELRFYDLVINDINNNFIMHPDSDVDLCALPLGGWLTELATQDIHPDIFSFSQNELEDGSNITPIEDVYMTGYPNGLWDTVNNRPITRKGITASHVAENWNGKQEFMIDMACFGGSSGSPVFIMNEGSYASGIGIAIGTRLKLLGILHSGPTLQVNGDVLINEIPTATTGISTSTVMINLGMAIKATRLNYFKTPLGITW